VTVPETRRLGVAFTPLETRAEMIVEAGVLAEEFGFHHFSIAEGWSYDSTHLLAEIARRTERIELIASVLSVYGRSAGTIAMTAATLQRLTGGRFTLGLGVSTAALVEGFHDQQFVRPAARLERYVSQVTALLNGERLPDPVVGEVRALRLGSDPAPDLEVLVAAMSPATLDLTARLGDGWLPFFIASSSLGAVMGQLADVRPPDLAPLRVCPPVLAAVGSNAEKARAHVAANFVLYMTVMGDIYPRLVREQGYGKELELILTANKSPSDGIVPEEAEELLAAYCIYGAPDDAQAQLGTWYEAGATDVALLMPPNASFDAIVETMTSFRDDPR